MMVWTTRTSFQLWGDAWCPSVIFWGKCSLSQPEPKNNLPADLLDVSKISAKLSRGGLLVNFGTSILHTELVGGFNPSEKKSSTWGS